MALTQKIANRTLKVAAGAATFMLPGVAHADCAPSVQGGVDCAKGNLSSNSLTSSVSNIIYIMIFSAGIIAVILIIIGGIRYIISQGDEKAIEGAKNTILYAVVGLIVATLAFAIVTFVLGGLNK